MYPSWFGGTSEHIWKLIDTHAFLDSGKYCIIAVDAPGNGISTSPSNSKTQSGFDFPEIRIADMARAERALLRRLDIRELHAVVGGSMGSMQGFAFISAYPEMAEKAVLYVCSPRESAYDLLRSAAVRDIIETGEQYGVPPGEYMKAVNILQTLHGRTPDHYAHNVTPEEVPGLLEKFDRYRPGIFPPENFYCQSRAISTHDISRRDGGDMEKTASRIKTELFLIVNRRDHLVHPLPAMEFAKMQGSRILVLDNEHGHLGITPEIKRVRRAIRRFMR
jgi:homoserine O-acetyltransferase